MRALERDNRKIADQRLKEAREEYLKNHAIRAEEWAKAEVQASIEMVKDKLSGPLLAKDRFACIFSELLFCPSDGWVKKGYLADAFDVTKKTIQEDVRSFWSLKLINRSNHGYQPTPKFFQLAKYLQEKEPGIYDTLKRG